MKKQYKILLSTLTLVLALYIVYPYYCTYQLVQAIKSGSPDQLEEHVNFPQLKISLKQQLDSYIDEYSYDPMSKAMVVMFKPTLERMIDELVKPEVFAGFLKSGELPNKRRKPKSDLDAEQPEALEISSWYAFFASPSQFEFSLNGAALYLELNHGHWQLSSVGLKRLMAPNAGKAKDKMPVVEVLDLNPFQPELFADLAKLKHDMSSIFFITGQFNNKARVEGDFYSLKGYQNMKPEVSWLQAHNQQGISVLSEFTAEEIEKREKYNSANNYYEGKWSDEAPITAGEKVSELKGICQIKVITKIEHIKFSENDIKQLKVSADRAATLTSLADGSVSLSYYIPAGAEGGLDQMSGAIFVVKNAQGQAIKQTGTLTRRSKELVQLQGLAGDFHGVGISLDVAGTPASLDIYFPTEKTMLKSEFIAKLKPEVSFGKIKTAIDTERYAPALNEKQILAIDLEYLKANSTVEFIEKTTWDKTQQRSLKITLPDIGNTVFAKPDYAQVEAYLAGKKVSFKPLKSHSPGNVFSIEFGQPDKEWDKLMVDSLKGQIKIQYPAAMSTFRINTGEKKNGASLNGSTLTYPKNSNIPDYTFVWRTRSAQAYSGDGKVIQYLDNAGFWSKDGNAKVLFWGKPAYVELKRVDKWLELKLDVDQPLIVQAE